MTILRASERNALHEDRFFDPEPSVRRHALREVAQLGNAATNLLAEIDLMAESDRSLAVRHLARRSGNVLRGLPSDAGVFEVAVESQNPP